jgi:hypothetical protein
MGEKLLLFLTPMLASSLPTPVLLVTHVSTVQLGVISMPMDALENVSVSEIVAPLLLLKELATIAVST